MVPTPAVITTVHLRLPAATLGPDSPLPAFTGLQRLPDVSTSPHLPQDMRERIEYGRLDSPLPYPVQSDYGRDRSERLIPAISLANERLEAVALPQHGGRLWSLRHLPSGRDLVYRNPVLAFANFGLTGAWFAGGVEWNLGSTGHAAFSTRDVFAAAVDGEDGPILRLWEWERTRDLIFQVDLSLPAGSDFLHASIRVRNLDPTDKPLYWWTNIAVAESDGVRVVAPATSAWRTEYDGTISSVRVPQPADGTTDVSYSIRARQAADYFFQIPPNRRKWITSLDSSGSGLIQTSTAELTGRKLFLWGRGAGGNRWQEWLSGPDGRYQEIQAGLATTQLEHLRLGPNEEISWSEALGPITLPPEVVHGDWSAAGTAIDGALQHLLPEDDVAERHARWRSEIADRPPGTRLHRGSGFGLAELALREMTRDAAPGTPFDNPTPDGARHLLALLSGVEVDAEQAASELPIPPISPGWHGVFAGAPRSWWSLLMIAIRAHADGDLDTARTTYRQSIATHRSAWALRGLAASEDDVDHAAELYLEAIALEPECRPLLVEATEALLRAGRARDCLQVLDAAPQATADHGRLILQRVRALIADRQLATAAKVIEDGFDVADLREGDTLEDLWRLVFGAKPLPARYDFRMGGAHEPPQQDVQE